MSDILRKVWPNWEIVKLKGEGSFGKVYEIRRRDIGGEYSAALKVISIPKDKAQIDELRTEGLDDKTATSYFQGMMEELVKEFATLEKLKGNSNIVSYEDHEIVEHKGEIGWDIYIRMELLKPLSEKMSEGMKVTDVLQLGIDICKALEVCQDVGIIHRDIKLENIFVSSRGDYKLGDFGIARTAEKTLSNMSKKGTYGYMAPEVFKGEPYNHTVDIYSLGIVLYRLLNGNRLPFMPDAPQPITFGDKEEALQRRMNGETLKPPIQISGEFADIILKACAYRVKDRYQSARDMRNALEKVDLNKGEKEADEKASRRFEGYSKENSREDIRPEDETESEEETELLQKTQENETIKLEDDTLLLPGQKSDTTGRKKFRMAGICAAASVVGIFILGLAIYSGNAKKDADDALTILAPSEMAEENVGELPLMEKEKEEENVEQKIFSAEKPMKENETEEITEGTGESSPVSEKKPIKKPEQSSAKPEIPSIQEEQKEPSSEEQPAPSQESQPENPSEETKETPENPSEESKETPDDPPGESTETPDNPSGESTETPDNPSGESTETPDDPPGESTETPDNPPGESTETPDNPPGESTETPDNPPGESTETPEEPSEETKETPDNPSEESKEASEDPSEESNEVIEDPSEESSEGIEDSTEEIRE